VAEPAQNLSLLERRRIVAGVLVHFFRAMQAEVGEVRVNEIVGRAIRSIASAQGEAQRGAALLTIPEVAARFERGVLAEGSLLVDVVQRDDDGFGFEVTRCQFMEMYEEMGARDLGYLLSCNRDFALFEGLAPNLEFSRTQTRMEGATHCDFRYRVRGD
jgi:hypothetical protein